MYLTCLINITSQPKTHILNHSLLYWAHIHSFNKTSVCYRLFTNVLGNPISPMAASSMAEKDPSCQGLDTDTSAGSFKEFPGVSKSHLLQKVVKPESCALKPFQRLSCRVHGLAKGGPSEPRFPTVSRQNHFLTMKRCFHQPSSLFRCDTKTTYIGLKPVNFIQFPCATSKHPNGLFFESGAPPKDIHGNLHGLSVWHLPQ